MLTTHAATVRPTRKRLNVSYRGPLTGRTVAVTVHAPSAVVIDDGSSWLVGRHEDGSRCAIPFASVLGVA